MLVGIVSFQGSLLLTPGLGAHSMVAAPGSDQISASGSGTKQ